VDELTSFGANVLLVSIGVSLALLTMKLTHRVHVPAPALFLAAAALLSDLFPGLADAVSTETVARIGVVALIVILLDGGMHVGWRRFRRAAVPITVLGVLGTFATAAVMAFFAHLLFGFDWVTAGIIGAALAPTDPAVMFSVLGDREIGGRTGTILEGESGANDPVGIALMIGMLELATHDDASFAVVIEEFALEMAVGLGVGVAGAGLLLFVTRRVSLPSPGLYPLAVLALAGVIYGAAAVLHGSGFLAVFVAGLMIGDERTPFHTEVESFHTSLASLAEIAVFIALGLTIDLGEVFGEGHWLDGLVLAVVLALVARPLVVGLLLLGARLRWGERAFVIWGGLKGAVPILLAAFAVIAAVDDADRIYGIVFVVVMFSVLVQGTSIGAVAARLGIPMRSIEHQPLTRSPGRVLVEGESDSA
jgi:cell volume regulation protein A